MTRTRRRGTAPLELVLVLPLLFTLMTVGWWCVRAGLTKTAAATDARRTAWEKRADADPGTPFDLRQKPLVSAVESEVLTDVSVKSPITGETVQARSFALMTDKTWDFEQFEFPRLPVAPVAMHRKRLLHFGLFIPFIQVHGPRVAGFADMDLPANPRFSREIPKALELRAERLTTTPTFVLGPVAMAAAIAQCAVNAVKAPPLAGYYAYLAEVIGRGIVPSVRLVPVSVK